MNKLHPFDPMEHDNSAADMEALRELAQRMKPSLPLVASTERPCRAVAVEIGSWAGMSTMILADVGFDVFAVDHWEGNECDRLGELAKKIGPDKAFLTFCRNMGPRLLRTVYPLRGTSKLWAEAWTEWGPPIDFLYIDASHRYKACLEDIIIWTPHVRTQGIIAGHDYYKSFPGVQRAVEETGPFETEGDSIWWRWKEKETA